jgi:hypothetical protein
LRGTPGERDDARRNYDSVRVEALAIVQFDNESSVRQPESIDAPALDIRDSPFLEPVSILDK